MRIREPLSGHLADVAAVEPFAAMPTEWIALRQRWSDFLLQSRPCREQFVAALITGDGSDTGTLFALALAEEAADRVHRAEVRRHAAANVCAALESAYKPIAQNTYRTIAKQFDTAAKHDDYHLLDEVAPALIAAARLCGADRDVTSTATNRLGLALTVDTRKAHLRHVADAFTTPERWQRVTDLGARIRASANPLTTYPDYRPHPLRRP